MNSQTNQISFKWDNGSDIATFQISGVKVQVAQFRKHIEASFNAKRDDFKIYHENRLLDISDEVRNKQLLNLVRTPKNRTNCLSCYNKEYSVITPCCQKQICSNCENVFCQKSKCFFNINPSCYFKYTENFQNVVPEPSCDEFITYNSIFYLIRTNKIALANAKRNSVWSAREMTYLKLSQECNIPANVILIFINNDELVGLAKMINQLVVFEQQNPLFKSFKIHWLRQQPSFKRLYDFQIYDLREYLKLSTGLGKAICYSFPIGQMNSENKLPEQQQSTSDAWDLDEIFKEEAETVKKSDECIKPKEQVSSFMQHCADEKYEQENNKEKQSENKVVNAVTNLAQIQELFNKMNNGSIPGIKGDNKYIHPILSKLCLSLMSSSNDDSSDNQKLKKKKKSRSPSNRKKDSKERRSKRRSSSSRDKKSKRESKHGRSPRKSQKEKEKFRQSQKGKEMFQSSQKGKEKFHSNSKDQRNQEKKSKITDKVGWKLEQKQL